MNKIKYIGHAMLWFDKVNGNTYHSVQITRCKDKQILFAPCEYGYGEQYKQSALSVMLKSCWIEGYTEDNVHLYESENEYPIFWITQTSTKKRCVKHGTK